ncbi:MAG: mannan-binding lectin [Magnetococcales bacterium]|nr:mannan-binding lectin [Magnetococcales bacterium]
MHMKKILVLAGFLGLFAAGSASAYDIPSVNLANGQPNPIWNNADAKGKCEPVCKPFGGWNGNWLTTVPGRMSVCGCNINPNIVNCRPGPGAILQ